MLSNHRGLGVLLRQQSAFPATPWNKCLVGTKVTRVVLWDRSDRGTTAERDIPLAIDGFSTFPPSRVIAHLHKVGGFKTFFILLSRLVHPPPPIPLFPLCPPGSQYTVNDFRDHFPLCALLVWMHSYCQVTHRDCSCQFSWFYDSAKNKHLAAPLKKISY